MKGILFSLLILSTTLYANQPIKTLKKDSTNVHIKRFYYNDGLVAIERFYKKNKRILRLKSYYNTGKLNEHFQYNNEGKLHGESYKFENNGEKIVTWEFNNGKLIRRTDHKIIFNRKNEEQVKKRHLALKKVNEMLKQNPNSVNLLYRRANMRFQLYSTTLALNDFIKLKKIFLNPPEGKKASDKILANVYDCLGSIYANYEMEDKAVHFKLKAIKTSPESMRLYYNMGAYLASLQCNRLAIVYLNKAREFFPKHVFSNWILGGIYSDFEQYEKAMECINYAFKNEKGLNRLGSGAAFRDIRTIRGLLHHKLGNSVKGIKDLEDALDINENNPFALRNLGVVYHDLGKYSIACELLNKSKKLGYEKSFDRDDLQYWLDYSCENKKPEETYIKISKRPYVYPNPADEFISMQNYELEDFLFDIYNYNGQLVFSGISKSKTINVSHLAAGVYVLKIVNNGIIESYKVIKK